MQQILEEEADWEGGNAAWEPKGNSQIKETEVEG
jgi:hypothetical protein